MRSNAALAAAARYCTRIIPQRLILRAISRSATLWSHLLHTLSWPGGAALITTLGRTAPSGLFLSLSCPHSSPFVSCVPSYCLDVSGSNGFLSRLCTLCCRSTDQQICTEPGYVLSLAEEKQAPFRLYLVSVRVTYCVKVPDSLEREPLPEAHPALLSHRRGPAGSLIYMSQPHKSPSSGATKLLQGLSGVARFRHGTVPQHVHHSSVLNWTPNSTNSLQTFHSVCHQSEEAVPFSRTVFIETRPHRAALTEEGRD